MKKLESLEKSKFKKLNESEMTSINGGRWQFVKQYCAADGHTVNEFQQVGLFGGEKDNWMQSPDQP